LRSKLNKKIKTKILAIDNRKENLMPLEAVLEGFEYDLYSLLMAKWS